MFKKELLIIMLLSSLIANFKNDIGYKQIKNTIYQNYKIICNKEIYYLNDQDKVMFNFDNIDINFRKYLTNFENVSISNIEYLKQDNYIYPTYTNNLTYTLNLNIGFKEYKFNLTSTLLKRR